MPNHITNKIEITGPQDDIDKLLQSVKTEDTLFDFNTIIPMPEELIGTSAPSRVPNQKFIDKYGFDNWYDWSNKNWGTKWNAYDVTVDNNMISFDTAWSCADILIHKLSSQFPQLNLELTYASEDIGYNCGIVKYQNGVELNYLNKSIGNLEDDETSIRWAMNIIYGSDDNYDDWYSDHEDED